MNLCIIILCTQVPAWHDEAKKSLAKFNSVFPAFHYLGKEVHIAPTLPFDTDDDVDVQLVCKYFKAKQEGNLDQWKHRKLYNQLNCFTLIYIAFGYIGGNRNRMPYLIGKIVPDLNPTECQKVLENSLPSNMTTRPKIIQRLYMK